MTASRYSGRSEGLAELQACYAVTPPLQLTVLLTNRLLAYIDLQVGQLKERTAGSLVAAARVQ